MRKVTSKIDNKNYELAIMKNMESSYNELVEKLGKQKDMLGRLQKQNEKLKEDIEHLKEEVRNLN